MKFLFSLKYWIGLTSTLQNESPMENITFTCEIYLRFTGFFTSFLFDFRIYGGLVPYFYTLDLLESSPSK